MSILAALNLTLPSHLAGAAPPAGAAKSPPPAGAAKRAKDDLTDADFPTDAKHRVRDDKARADAKAKDAKAKTGDKAKGDAPADKKPGPTQAEADQLDKMIEEAIGDPEKRLKALAELKVPRFAKDYEEEDKEPMLKFLKDVASGAEKAKEYVDYVQKMAERAEKFSDITGLDQIGRAAGKLKKITGVLDGGLKKWGKRIDTAQDVARWVIALDAFADASAAMDPRDRKSVERWVGQMKRLWDATAPFAEWAHGELVNAAFAGSEVAGAAAATMAIVGAQLFIGVKVLEQGVKNVNAYLDRYDRIMKEIEEEAGTRARPQLPPPPPFPGDWMTRDEMKAQAVQMETDGLRRVAAEAKAAVAKRRAIAERAAGDHFDKVVLPKLYMAARPKYIAQILTTLRKNKNNPQHFEGTVPADARSPESRWWDCFLGDQSESKFDAQSGMYLGRPKGKVTLEEATYELDNFDGVKPPFPPIKGLIEPARANFVKAAGEKAASTP